jgi:peptide/nickel transport system permease protein
MVRYIMRRLLLMIPTLFLVSVVSFIIIQLPPGDFLTVYTAELAASGAKVDTATLEALRETYGLDQPIYIQYWKWISRVIQGDFGRSFRWERPVAELVWERLALTLIVALFSLLFTWLIAIPVGILSAVRQYSWADYLATLLGFLGLAVPEFLLALILMVGAFLLLNQSVGGLFSPEYAEAPWSLGRVIDLFRHLWIPMIILGLGHATLFIRILRANLLDELRRPYVTTARAKGLTETQVLLRYPVRMALNPFVSTVGWRLPDMISGLTIVSIVLSLPTTGPMLLDALISQDMFLAGAFILLLSVMTLVGTLISDILLAWLDPRIRLQYEE